MPINHAEQIRNALSAVVSQRLHVPVSGDSILETTLIRNGAYCGRRFVLSGFSLVWFLEEGQIKFYAPSGNLELSCSLQSFCESARENIGPQRRAA